MRSALMLLALLPSLAVAQPVIEVPPVGATSTNVPVVFSTAGYDAPRLVGDPAGPIRLAAVEGTLTLASTEGLAFDLGDGEADAEMVMRGDAAAVNAALDGLVYTPPQGFAGGVEVTLSADETSRTWRVAVNAVLRPGDARNQLLAGVERIHGGVNPGFVVAFGPQAYDIAFFQEGAVAGPMVVAASWGAGRVVALPDHQALNMNQFGDQSGPFYRNGISWLGQGRADLRLVTLSRDIADWLRDAGYERVAVSDYDGLGAALADGDVLVAGWLGADVRQESLDTIGDFVRGGGGLFIADYGVGYDWWWGLPMHEAPGNLLLREAGVGFVGGTRGERYLVDLVRAGGQVNAERLLAMLAAPDDFGDNALERGGTTLAPALAGVPRSPVCLSLAARSHLALACLVRGVCAGLWP